MPADDPGQTQQARTDPEVLSFRGLKIDLDAYLIALKAEIDHSPFHGKAVHLAHGQNFLVAESVQRRSQTLPFREGHEKNVARVGFLGILDRPDRDGPAINGFPADHFRQSVAKRILSEDTNGDRVLRILEAPWGPLYKFRKIVNNRSLYPVFLANLGASGSGKQQPRGESTDGPEKHLSLARQPEWKVLTDLRKHLPGFF
jgi:hypothetical protein